MDGVFGGGLGDTAAVRYSADMAPQPVTPGVGVEVRAVERHRGHAHRHRRAVIGESIFGSFVHSNDSVPQEVPTSWEGSPTMFPADQPQPVNGFGVDIGPVDTAVPTQIEWRGHGIFGGRSHHGKLGMDRWGNAIAGFGMEGFGGYNPTPAPNTSFWVADTASGRGECGILKKKGTFAWPDEWVCNTPNAQTLLAAYDPVNTLRNPVMTIKGQPIVDKTGKVWHGGPYEIKNFVADMAGGTYPVPVGFPPIGVWKKTASSGNAALFIGLGVAALAIGGAVAFKMKKKAA